MATLWFLLVLAYFEVMGAWSLPYLLAGVCCVVVAWKKLRGPLRLPGIAFILALFFSLSLVVARGAVPVPTLFAMGLWAADTVQNLVQSPSCVPTSEGCLVPDEGSVWIVLPLLTQWALIYFVLLAGSLGRRWVARSRR